MPEKIIVYWRDIPAQVIIRSGRRNLEKRELSSRFVTAIDACAMKAGLEGSDEYLEQWRRSAPEEIETKNLSEAADKIATRFESDYTNEKLKQLIATAGYEC